MSNLDHQKHPRYVEALGFLYFLSPLFFIGSVLPLSRGIWIAIPLASLMALPFFYLYDQFLIAHRLHLSIRLIFMILAVFLGISGLFYFSRFVKICVMPETPGFLLPAAILLFAVWSSLKDIHVLERFSRIAAPIVFFLLCVSIISAATKIDFHFLENPLGDSLGSALGGTFFPMLWLIFALYLGEGLILLTLVRQQFKVRDSQEYEKPPAIFYSMAKGLLLSALLLSATYLITILALGPDVFEILTYPVYYPPGLTRSAEYLERIEILLLAVFLFSEFLRTGVFLLLLKEGFHSICTVFGNDE